MYLYALTLPSGELVAARINSDSVVKEGDSIYSGNNILPVGKVVMANLTEDEYFINQIEYKEKLSRTDFYRYSDYIDAISHDFDFFSNLSHDRI